ncbi:MAG: N-acetylneuraminate synthase [Planctomycetes bacterium]|nr:N-acetylneuraminate synthase [Planctomycetota bacterium]
MPSLRIGASTIGPDRPCFVIAEAGVNHDGCVDQALALVDVAAFAGADAVKFQTFQADRLVTRDARKAAYQAERTGADETQADMLRRLELSADAHYRIAARCEEQEITFLSTPFDEESCDFLCALGLPALKLPSGEITNLAFLAHCARTGRPLILSTGMATLDDVATAVAIIRGAGDPPLALLHCVSDYPADPADANLRAMATLAERFQVPIGWSDHTPGTAVSVAAVALGAAIVEKHITLDATLPGPDHAASLEPNELNALVRGIRMAESALGSGLKVPAASEAECAQAARRSLVAARDLPAGHCLDSADLVARRPGTGISPARLEDVIGHVLVAPIKRDTPLDWDHVPAARGEVLRR